MTVNTQENMVPQPIQQEKVDTNLQQDKVDTSTQQKEPSTPETNEDPNWRAFREARKKDRAEREAAEKRAADKEQEVAALKAAMEAAFSRGNTQQQQQSSNQYGYVEEETQEQLIDKRVNAAIAAREEQYRREQAEREAREYPQRLAQTYPDFNQAIAQENLDYLDYHYPEVSQVLQRLPEGYDKWAAIYKNVKKFVPNHTNMKKDAAKADANFNKPRSISTTGVTQSQPVQGSHILTQEKREANWERMQRALKGLS